MSGHAIVEYPSLQSNAAPPQENGHYDLVDGVWVEKKMGAKSSRVGFLVGYCLETFNQSQPCGLVFVADCGYKIFPHTPRLVRYPDASFVRFGRLPNDEPPDGHMVIAPDLAVEVVSPNDLAEEIEERVMDYLRVDVPLIWVLYPKNRTALVVRQGSTATHLTASEEVNGEKVLPGFACRVERFFPQVVS